MEEEATPRRWRLAVTARCLEEDLRLPPGDWHRYQDTHPVLSAFAERLSQRAIGRERILELVRVLPAAVFSLHSENARGATWYDQEEDIVWLLAVGEAHNYDHIISLGQRRRLMPTVEDYDQFEVATATPNFANAIVSEAAVLVRAASRARDELLEGVLAGRVSVRLCQESDDPDFLVVAISKRVLPGDVELPAEWLLEIAATFFPGVPFEEFPPFPLEFDNTFVRDDELAIRHWAPRL